MSYRLLPALLTVVLSWLAETDARERVVTDSLTGERLAKASVFDTRGSLAGICTDDGRLPAVSATAYPLTIRYMGYAPATVERSDTGPVLLRKMEYDLPEIVVESKKRDMLHLIGYVREFSTLTTYSDTVFLFREKTVDFMIPAKRMKKATGWTNPRILDSRSFYHFSNSEGTDSVCPSFGAHFSWADWVGLFRNVAIPDSMRGQDHGTLIIRGRHGPSCIWRRNEEDVTLDVDILAEYDNRKWIPGLAGFIDNGLDLRRMNMRYIFTDVAGDEIFPGNLARMSFHIESNGRGRNLSMFFHPGDPVYVDTYAEIYITDMVYISAAEARKWEKDPHYGETRSLQPPSNAPELHPSVQAIVDRVNSLDYGALRLDRQPDKRYAGKKDFDKIEKRGFLQSLKSILRL